MAAQVVHIDHPLVKHKISRLRDITTLTGTFRTLVEEITVLMGYEALRDMPTAKKWLQTPLEECTAEFIMGRTLAIVPILRAGLGMVPGLTTLVPEAKIGHIGMYRDHDTHEPHEYYCKLPDALDQRIVVVVDPMLATGGSAVDAIHLLKKHGAKRIKFMCIIAAPEGLQKLAETHPDIQIYVGQLDRELDSNKYIRPGLGDAGDRIFGTK